MRDERLTRWRLLLGRSAEEALDGRAGMTADDMAADAAMEWLYDREEAESGEGQRARDIRDR